MREPSDKIEFYDNSDNRFEKTECTDGTHNHPVKESIEWDEAKQQWSWRKKCVREGCEFAIGYGSASFCMKSKDQRHKLKFIGLDVGPTGKLLETKICSMCTYSQTLVVKEAK